MNPIPRENPREVSEEEDASSLDEVRVFLVAGWRSTG
jgi:hypothetical protein